jgi:hypothetical protein
MTTTKTTAVTTDSAAVEETVNPTKTASRFAIMKNFVTSPTFITTAPIYVAAGVAIILAARKPMPVESEDV